MEITEGDVKTLKKLIESPDWSVYRKVVDNLKLDIKDYILLVDINLPEKEYNKQIRNAVALHTCLDKIDNEIASLLFKKDASVKDIMDDLDPYTKKK